MTNQNDLQAVIERAKADIARKYVFVHMPIPQLETLIAGLEDLQRENERMKEALEEVSSYREILPTDTETYELAEAFLVVEDKASYALSTLACTP